MHTAVQLDCQLGRIAIEIDDESFDHLLTAEMETVQRISPKHRPENALCGRHLAPQSLRERELLGFDVLTADDLAVFWAWRLSSTYLTPNPFPTREGEPVASFYSSDRHIRVRLRIAVTRSFSGNNRV